MGWSGLKQVQTEMGYERVWAIAPAPNRIDLFYDAGGFLYHVWGDGTQFHNWESLGVPLYSPISVTSRGPSPSRLDVLALDVFALDVNSALIHNWQLEGQPWDGWKPLGGPYTSPPSAVSWGPNRIDVFMLGQNHDLRWLKFDGNWNAEQPLGGVYTSPPSAVSWGPNRIDVFMLGQNHDLRWLKFDGTWNAEQPLGGIYTSPPSAVSWGPGEIDVFMLGQNHALWHNGTYGNSGGNFNGEDSRGGENLISQPAAVSWVPGRLDVFVVGPNAPIAHFNLWHDSWS